MGNFLNGTVLLNGRLTGTLTGSTLDYRIAVNPGGIPSQPSCTGQLGGTSTVPTTSTMSGSFSLISTNCPPPVTNTSFTLARQ